MKLPLCAQKYKTVVCVYFLNGFNILLLKIEQGKIKLESGGKKKKKDTQPEVIGWTNMFRHHRKGLDYSKQNYIQLSSYTISSSAMQVDHFLPLFFLPAFFGDVYYKSAVQEDANI